MATYTIESCNSGRDIWTGEARDCFDAVRSLFAETGEDLGDDDCIMIARNPEWTPDLHVTETFDSTGWQVRIVKRAADA